MPLETLQTLQDLEITGTAASQQQAETQCEPIESHEQQPAQPFHPSAPAHPASKGHSFEQPHSAPFYPPLLDSFGLGSDATIPIDPGLLDAHFGHPAAPGPGGGGGGVVGVPLHQAPWPAQPGTSVNMDSFMVSPTSLPQYNSSMPLVPGMSSFEPMVSTAWSMDGSLPSTSASRGPTMSSSLSVHGTSTPASSQSPSSPRKVSSGMAGSRAASREAMPSRSGAHVEPRAGDRAEKKRRQSSGFVAPQKKSAEKRSHRNNSSPGFTTPPVPIAPAPIAVASTNDSHKKNKNKKKHSSSSSNHHQTTTTTTTRSDAPSDPPQASPTAQPTTLPAQQPAQQPPQPAQPDPRARNREAANRCRAKSKVAVAELEATERAMGAEHQALTQTARSLRDEVLQLKNQLLMHGNCHDDLIQQYLANSARAVGSGVLGPAAAGGVGVPRMQPVQVPVPALVVPPGAGGSRSSSRGMVSASPPGMLPGVPPGVMPGVFPSSSAPGPGTTAARGHQKGGGRRRQ